MSSEVETSLIISWIARDGKPGLADYVGCVAASTSLGMAKDAAFQKLADRVGKRFCGELECEFAR
jgi:hypothetical protein